MNSSKIFKEKSFVFIAGLHKSGTSLLHGILRSHPEISGFENTCVPEDEGQHLQTVYRSVREFGGPGKFAFKQKAYMDESHDLATEENAGILFAQWSKYWNMDCTFLVEKSPANIISTRFLQKLFPRSIFVVILRHPVAVAFATRKWCKSSVPLLIDHTLRAYEQFFHDITFLNRVFILRYEDFVNAPQENIDRICRFIGVSPFQITHAVRDDINVTYFKAWDKFLQVQGSWDFGELDELENRLGRVGYSLKKQG